MKRALAATFVGGLLIFSIPQAASAGTGNAHRLVAHETAPGENGSDTATKPAGDSRQDPPGEGRSHFDRQHHDDNNTF